MIKGKLKQTIKENCPMCGNTLQIRTIEIKSVEHGEDIVKKKEIKICPNDYCDYEENIKNKKQR